jgi:hypothetical protein
MMGEIFPTSVRGLASAVATTINWTCAFIITETFSSVRDSIGSTGVFWLYAGVCFAGCLFVHVRVPETKVSLEGTLVRDIEGSLACGD